MSEQRRFYGSEMREMLRAMQSGEMTVSRGVELVDMWLGGNYSDEQLPPVRNELGEDEMPWDRIDALTKQRDELQAKWDYYQEFCKSHEADGITQLVAQRDWLRAALQKIAASDPGEGGCYYTNRENIHTARSAISIAKAKL